MPIKSKKVSRRRVNFFDGFFLPVACCLSSLAMFCSRPGSLWSVMRIFVFCLSSILMLSCYEEYAGDHEVLIWHVLKFVLQVWADTFEQGEGCSVIVNI